MTTTTYELDPVHSHLGFSVRHMMVSHQRGRFQGVTGTLTLPGAWLACPAPLKACVLNTLIKSSTQINVGKVKRIRVLSAGSVRVNVTGKAAIQLRLSSGALKYLPHGKHVAVLTDALVLSDQAARALIADLAVIQ